MLIVPVAAAVPSISTGLGETPMPAHPPTIERVGQGPAAEDEVASSSGALGATLGLWGLGPDVDRVAPTSTVLYSSTYTISNPDNFIFWLWDPATLTYVLCDNHWRYSFSGLPDGHRSITIGTVPLNGAPDFITEGQAQGYDVDCEHVADLLPDAKQTFRVTTPGLCQDGACQPIGPGLAGEFALLPV